MAVGQFFNPDEGKKEFSPRSLLLSSYIQEVNTFNKSSIIICIFVFFKHKVASSEENNN